MSTFNEEHPFGIEKVVITTDQPGKRILFDPNNVVQVCRAMMELCTRRVEAVIIRDKHDPIAEIWKAEVIAGRTLRGFEEWKEKYHG